MEALSRDYVPLELEVLDEMVTRAAAELASVVHTLRNALLEVVAKEGHALTVNSVKALVRYSALAHETLCHTSASVLCSTLQDCRYNVCNNSSAIRPQRMQKRIPAHH